MDKDKQIKQLTIMGTIWDFWNVTKIFDKLFKSRYISFYKPWLKGEIDKNKIVEFYENNQSIVLWPLKIIIRTFKILKEINKFKPDMVVTHHDDANVTVLLSLIIVKYILRKKIKFVAYIHNGNFEERSLLNIIISFCIKHLYRHFDMIVTVSYENKIMLQNKFGLKNIEVIYNPVDVEGSIKMAQNGDINNEKYVLIKNIKKDNFIIGHLGRLTKQKGQEFLIKAFKKIHEKHHNTKLIIIGIGELENKLKKLAEDLGIENDIIFLGRQENVYQFLNMCDCFILPSLWESFGQVLVETLLLNKLVISTDCKSGPREVLIPEINLGEKIDYPYYGKYGILIEPFNNENRFVKNIYKILTDVIEKKNQDNYLHGLERAKEFDISNIENIYKKLFLHH